ncbi:MAG: class I SAM-dependent methyltransferase [Hyphomonadaceae bacterium]
MSNGLMEATPRASAPAASGPAARTEQFAAFFSVASSLASEFITRESRWRRALAAQIAPRASDVILEIGCGAVALSVELARLAPRARIIAVDWDEALLQRARERAREAGVRIEFVTSFPRAAARAATHWAPNKIVANIAYREMAPVDKRALIQAAHDNLRADGIFNLADAQSLRTPFLPQQHGAQIDAATAARPVDEFVSAPRRLIAEMRAAGFVAVEETQTFAAPAGAVSLYRARVS